MGGKRRDKPRTSIEPVSGKQPRVAPEFEGPSDHIKPAWRFAGADRGGPWHWRGLPQAEVHDALEKLGSLEGITWTQMKSSGSHAVALYKLCPGARERLKEVGKDDLDELFSVRLTGRRRLWGVRKHHILSILWWDPEHEVCPSLRG